MTTCDKDIPDHFMCPLTMEMMQDPLFSKYGHHFERSAILQWLSQENTCPITRQPLFPSMLIPDNSLRLRMHAWRGALASSDEDVVVSSRRPSMTASFGLRDEEEIQVIRTEARRSSLQHNTTMR